MFTMIRGSLAALNGPLIASGYVVLTAAQCEFLRKLYARLEMENLREQGRKLN